VDKVEAYESQSDDELAAAEREFNSVYLCQVSTIASVFFSKNFYTVTMHIFVVHFVLISLRQFFVGSFLFLHKFRCQWKAYFRCYAPDLGFQA